MFIRVVAFALLILALAGSAYAQSSLGIGNAEQSVGTSGGFFQWIGTEQRAFYKQMTGALANMRQDGSAVWLLIGLSFIYGILHAAGPGHGKVVISSYMLANETALRRGVVLSFAASALQAISAIVIVGAGFLVLRGTSLSMTGASVWLEKASYVLVILFGLWLLWRKLHAARTAKARTPHAHDHSHDDHHHHHHDHDHEGEGDVCSSCGHAHMPNPSQLEGKMDWRAALAAIVAVGVRPCTGAVVVLSFALLNGLYVGGVVSVFAMALGTAITVSTLATIAVTAKNVALRYSGSAVMNARVQTSIELVGASLLVVLGLLMLGGALAV